MNQQPSIFLPFERWQLNSNAPLVLVPLGTLSLATLPLNTHAPFMAMVVTMHDIISPSNKYVIWLYFDYPHNLIEPELCP